MVKQDGRYFARLLIIDTFSDLEQEREALIDEHEIAMFRQMMNNEHQRAMLKQMLNDEHERAISKQVDEHEKALSEQKARIRGMSKALEVFSKVFETVDLNLHQSKQYQVFQSLKIP